MPAASVALKVTFASHRRHRVIATVHTHAARRGHEPAPAAVERRHGGEDALVFYRAEGGRRRSGDRGFGPDVAAREPGSARRPSSPRRWRLEAAPSIRPQTLETTQDSFCETAENFFDLSFLVKDARATVGVDDTTGLPVCRLAEAPDGAVPKTQNVVVLSMADCKAIGELWGIEKPQLPREAGARERAQAAAQRAPPPPPDDGEESDAY